jgi:hypothetical protein
LSNNGTASGDSELKTVGFVGGQQDLLAGGGGADVPAVGQVEQAPNHVDADGRPRGTQVIGTGWGCVCGESWREEHDTEYDGGHGGESAA